MVDRAGAPAHGPARTHAKEKRGRRAVAEEDPSLRTGPRARPDQQGGARPRLVVGHRGEEPLVVDRGCPGRPGASQGRQRGAAPAHATRGGPGQGAGPLGPRRGTSGGRQGRRARDPDAPSPSRGRRPDARRSGVGPGCRTRPGRSAAPGDEPPGQRGVGPARRAHPPGHPGEPACRSTGCPPVRSRRVLGPTRSPGGSAACPPVCSGRVLGPTRSPGRVATTDKSVRTAHPTSTRSTAFEFRAAYPAPARAASSGERTAPWRGAGGRRPAHRARRGTARRGPSRTLRAGFGRLRWPGRRWRIRRTARRPAPARPGRPGGTRPSGTAASPPSAAQPRGARAHSAHHLHALQRARSRARGDRGARLHPARARTEAQPLRR